MKSDKPMKKIILACTIVVGALTGLRAQNSCDAYAQFKQGSQFVMTNFSPKGKVEGTTETKVTKVTKTGTTVESQAAQVTKDDKGKETATSNTVITCTGTTIKVDLSSIMLSYASANAYKNYDMSFEGNIVEYPAAMQAGQTLADVEILMVMKDKGTEIMRMTMKMTNRKVEAKEPRTTSAGTFECFKITYDFEMIMGGAIPIRIKGKTTEWYSPGIGGVRMESYNQNGKMRGYTELTSFTKGS
jgi:hypothetical protein